MSADRFLQVFTEQDNAAHDEAEAAPFPAYIDDDLDKSLAPFCPTSARRVLKALAMAKVSDCDQVIDLGSGDGRFCTGAVAVMGAAHALGIESDQELVERSHALADAVFHGDQARRDQVVFLQGDLVEMAEIVRNPRWTVIVLFLLPDHTDKYADMLLAHYRRGGRIISLVFNLAEIKELELQSADEADGIYVYSRSAGK
ncbi:hypothetical protein BX666DRAFT_1861498 [Dichotomocladium elegans]|nr:hypothetical protein BX666DRAFT_1861498 [Dichotomocladium elegans]